MWLTGVIFHSPVSWHDVRLSRALVENENAAKISQAIKSLSSTTLLKQQRQKIQTNEQPATVRREASVLVTSRESVVDDNGGASSSPHAPVQDSAHSLHKDGSCERACVGSQHRCQADVQTASLLTTDCPPTNVLR